MKTTFQLNAVELNASILKSIKETFKGRNIEIKISDVNAPTNLVNESLAGRLENVERGEDIVSFTQEDFFNIYRKKVDDAANSL